SPTVPALAPLNPVYAGEVLERICPLGEVAGRLEGVPDVARGGQRIDGGGLLVGDDGGQLPSPSLLPLGLAGSAQESAGDGSAYASEEHSGQAEAGTQTGSGECSTEHARSGGVRRHESRGAHQGGSWSCETTGRSSQTGQAPSSEGASPYGTG